MNLKKQGKEFNKSLAEFTARKVAKEEGKPISLIGYEKKVKKELKNLGLAEPKVIKEVMSCVQKTEFFRLLMENEITDDELITGIKEGLVADKALVVNKEVEYVPDHNARKNFIDLALELKGINTRSKDESSDLNVSINVINPTM